MSSEINRMNVLSKDILTLLMDGMMEVDDVKSNAWLHDDEIAARLGVPLEHVREELAVLETLGYVTGAHAFGGDPTQAYKGVDEGIAVGTGNVERQTYYISDNGKLLLLAARDNEASSAPPS
jgi:predicted ArsR family transcriptional regulator